MAVDEYPQDGQPQCKEDWPAYRTVELTYEMKDYATAPRQVMPTRSPAERVTGFGEIALGFTKKAACAEAKRCLRCDIEPS